MEERRQGYIDLGKKLDYFEQNFYDLKIEVKEFIAASKATISNADNYREILSAKLDGINKLNDKIFERIDKITNNCIAQIPVIVEMKAHLKKEEKSNWFFKDKKYQILTISFTAMLGFAIWVIQQNIIDNTKKLQQEINYGKSQAMPQRN